MAQELGKIQKPEVEKFGKGRKLFLVPIIYAAKDAPTEYIEKFDLYWNQVSEQVRNLEEKLGSVRRVYHELISQGGKDGLKILEELNPKSYLIVSQKCQNNAELFAVENQELADENMDWQRCLLIGFISDKVATRISEFYMDSSRKRYEYIGKQIDKTLGNNEIAILFIREGHSVQFPKDIQVFSVAPPALNDIYRWLRNRANRQKSEDDS
jgi:hypothetical protein